MKKYKNLCESHPIRRDVTNETQWLMKNSGSISEMNNTELSGSHSKLNFYKWGLWNYKHLSGSHPIGRHVTSGSKWLMKFKVGPFHK
jgi:hypothetical protein